MDPARQYAYRSLLYLALLELRILPRPALWNPLAIRRACYLLARRAALANCLHNLAEFSRRDFEGFDENRFWREYETFGERFSDHLDYQRHFREAVTTYDPDNR